MNETRQISNDKGEGDLKVETFSDREQEHAKNFSLAMKMPNTSFGIALGLGGNCILWKTMHLTKFTSFVGDFGNCFFFYSAIVVWTLAFTLYIIKARCFPSIIKKEWSHPVRTHFFNCPHIGLLMISIGIPKNHHGSKKINEIIMTIAFCLCGLSQLFLTQRIYGRWLFGKQSNIGQARAPFLLSVIGWLLLSVLGQILNLKESFGINISAMCFGAGIFLYVIVIISIFMAMHSAKAEKGSPAMFLMIAPPAVAASSLANFTHPAGRFGDASCALFGWCIVLLFLLLSLSPQLLTKPVVLGSYWAYVFPLAALATASIQYANTEGSLASEIMAWIFIILAVIALIAVFLRMSWHHVGVLRGREKWGDPVFEAWEKSQAQMIEHHETSSSSQRSQSKDAENGL